MRVPGWWRALGRRWHRRQQHGGDEAMRAIVNCAVAKAAYRAARTELQARAGLRVVARKP
jgi:hypothetical protein